MVSENKKKLVQKFVNDIKGYPIIGLVNFENLPARQLQIMRATLLKNGVIIRMARKKLLKLSLQESKLENIDQLIKRINGLPALLFTKDNPFTLYSTLQKNKSPAPAKAGQTSPKDIVVKAGATNFAPGPIISELASIGVKTRVDSGKLVINEDTVVAKDGDVISTNLAGMLSRLDIQPMEVGLDLVAVWEEGTVFDAKQLHVDEEEYLNNFIQAAQWAMNLAVEAAIPTAETTELLLQKAFRDAKGLALEQGIINDVTAGDLLAKAEREALSVKVTANIETSIIVEKNEVVKEKPKPKSENKDSIVDEKVEDLPPKPETKEEKATITEKKEVIVEEKVEEPNVEEVKEKPKEEPKLKESKVEDLTPEPKNKEEEKVESQPKEVKEELQTAEKSEEKPTPETVEEPIVEEGPKEEPKPEETKEEGLPREENQDQKEQPTEEPTEEPKEEAKDVAKDVVVPVITEELKAEIKEETKPEVLDKAVQEEEIKEEPKEIPTQQMPEGAIPSAQSIIQAMKEKFGDDSKKGAKVKIPLNQPPKGVTAESLVEDEKRAADCEKKKTEESSDKSVEEAEGLFKELMKKGTLRDEE